MTTIYDDKEVLIITHDLGDIQLDRRHKILKARCVGSEGFKEQIALLKAIYNGDIL